MHPLLLALAVAFGVLPAVAPHSAEAGTPATAAVRTVGAPSQLVQPVTYQGRTVTVRLTPVSTRAPGFEVLVQQSDGALKPTAVPAPRSYLGSVDGEPAAVASAIVNSDGVVQGQIVFDRGTLWRFLGSSVSSTRGTTPPSTYKWPSATDAKLNATVAPGQAGRTSYRWDIGFDLGNEWFTAGPVSGSVPKAIDAVELATVSLLDVYQTNAMLRPAAGRVIIRATASRDPYGPDPSLSALRNEWRDNQAGAAVDDVAYFDPNYSGGVAYVGSAGTSNGASVNGGADAPQTVLRHELGHTWGVHDNHTNGPEGKTINSGNQYERFDGTELRSIFAYRDSRQAGSAPFTPEGPITNAVPPYAALDLVDRMSSGVPHSFRPIANDHDANLDRIALASAAVRSHLGGIVVRRGDVLTYTPPQVQTQTVDWVSYVVRDAGGKTATGVSLFRVDPFRSPGAIATWKRRTDLLRAVRYEVVNIQSGHAAGLRAGSRSPRKVEQRSRGNANRVVFSPRGRTLRIRSTGNGAGCWTAARSGAIEQRRCRNSLAQRWLVVSHPRSGNAIVNRSTGRCVAPTNASMIRGARLRLVKCGRSAAQSWSIIAPLVDSWSAVTPPAGRPAQLRVPESTRHLTAPTGSGALSLTTAAGSMSTFEFVRTGSGYTVRNTGSGRCLDIYGSARSAGAQVGTWGCNDGSNQIWQLLRNPAGDYSLRSPRTGYCLATRGESLVQDTCSFQPSSRWSIS